MLIFSLVCSFSVYLRCKGRLYEIFLNVFITKNFLLSTAFAISPELWYILLLFSFVSKYFKISFDFSFDLVVDQEWINFQVFVCFLNFLLLFISSFISLKSAIK